jgi:hypothetical protein
MGPLPSTPEQNPTPSGFEPRSVGTRPAPGAVANVKGIRRKIEDALRGTALRPHPRHLRRRIRRRLITPSSASVRPASIPRPRFELRTSEVAKPRPGDQLTVGGETFVVQGDPSEPDLNERQLHARRRVHQAMAALGRIGSPAGSCVWHVVGLQRSVREWAMRQGWGGRLVRQEQAQGILVAALGMLVAHFGYGEMRRAS